MKVRILVLFFIALTSPSAVGGEALTFGVVPQQSASKLARLWTPILTYLSEKSGVQLQFATAKNIPTFENRLQQANYDIAYMNPYHYTVFSEQAGYDAFAKQRDKRIRGIIVVREDSSLTQLSELSGSRLAFPSPAAFAASILPQAQLNLDAIEFQPNYVSSHDSVYLSVAKGLFVAGGGVMRTFNNTTQQVRSQLRVLWTTNPYTPHAFAAHARVSAAAVSKLHQALIDMNDDPEGKRLLKTINFNGMATATDSDWDDVRRLGISTLE